MKNFERHILALFLVGVFMWNCSENPVEVVGGASGTEVSCVISGGIITDGQQSARGAVVRLRPADFLSGVSKISEDTSLGTIADTLTSDDGQFEFPLVKPGDYTVEVITKDSLAVLFHTTILESDTLQHIPEDTVYPMAVIGGYVESDDGENTQSGLAKIQVYGIERYAHTDSRGKFAIPVPEGQHRLVMSLDTIQNEQIEVQIDITSGEYKDIGNLRLHHKHPRTCRSYSCDSSVVRDLLDFNGLTAIPLETVSSKKNERLSELRLRGYNLDEIPKDLIRLSELRVLDLGKNNIKESLRFLGNLKHLRVLKLDSNQIKNLSQSIERAFQLEVLELQDNLLEELPSSIIELQAIKQLNLSGNQLCVVSPQISTWADKYQKEWKDQQLCP